MFYPCNELWDGYLGIKKYLKFLFQKGGCQKKDPCDCREKYHLHVLLSRIKSKRQRAWEEQ